MKFENDIVIQKTMRHFSSYELAKIILHDPETREGFKRNMVEGCWKPIQQYLDDREFCETPQQAFERFINEYAKVNVTQEEI
jgi:hypothetical protein